MEYVGNRWYKCDFHLHTKASNCYKLSEGENDDNTYEKWVNRAQEVGLNCLAITDHNDYRSIDKIKSLCSEKGIIAFPGVEVTCDSSKIHILVLFDNSLSSVDVRNFLIRISIESNDSAGTSLSVREVCKEAKKRNAIVIAAHVDEMSGLSQMASQQLESFLKEGLIDAVQIVNQEFWEEFSITKDKELLNEKLNDKYQRELSFETIDTWRKTYDKVKKAGIPMILSSDNPSSDDRSKHGLDGIGKVSTLIKMDSKPSLESLRQALIANDTRISLTNKYDIEPDFWIKSIKAEKTTLNPKGIIKVDFNPQLNSIIGGRGSGKSSIIRLLSGVLGSFYPISIDEIAKEQNCFFMLSDKEKGVLLKESVIEVEVVRHNELYKIKYFYSKNDFITSIEKFDYDTNSYIEIEDGNFKNFFMPQVYTQKQIYEIAKQPKALMNIIDFDIRKEVEKLSDIINNSFLALVDTYNKKRTKHKIVDKESELHTKLNDINLQIEKYEKSGITESIKLKNQYDIELKEINDYIKDINDKFLPLISSISSIRLPEINTNLPDEIQQILDVHNNIICKTKENMLKETNSVILQLNKLSDDIKSTSWYNKMNAVNQKYQDETSMLQSEGINFEKYDSLVAERANLLDELKDVESAKMELVSLNSEIKDKEYKYIDDIKKLREYRQQYVNSILKDSDDLKIEYTEYGDMQSFSSMLINALGKVGKTVEDDIEKIIELTKSKGIMLFRNLITQIRKNEKTEIIISSYFKKAINGLSDEEFDKLLIKYPDDELIVSYKTSAMKEFAPISIASAGQKTTAILTFILSHGKIPLLLDQPEDDLDNKLVYDLIVQKLKEAKENRQIIVVTHNANIPVNGDSEFIVSMNSESQYVRVKKSGSIDSVEVRKEICDIMEGTEHAFKMRAQKYHMDI